MRAVADPGFPRGRKLTPEEGAPTCYLPNSFAHKSMKIKEIGLRGEPASLTPALDQLEYILHFTKFGNHEKKIQSLTF